MVTGVDTPLNIHYVQFVTWEYFGNARTLEPGTSFVSAKIFCRRLSDAEFDKGQEKWEP